MMCQDYIIGWERQNENCAWSDLLTITLLLIYLACQLALVDIFFPWERIGTPDELFWCCNLPTFAFFFFSQDSFFLNTELLGRSCHFAKGSTFPVLIPYPFHLFSQVTGKGHVCAHMQQVCSNSVSPGAIGGTVPGCVGPAAHWGEAVPRPLLLLQDNSGLFWMETWKEVRKF